MRLYGEHVHCNVLNQKNAMHEIVKLHWNSQIIAVSSLLLDITPADMGISKGIRFKTIFIVIHTHT